MALDWGSFAGAGLKELVASADPTLNLSEAPVSERYVLGEEIGCGSYGRALLAQRIEDGQPVVVKQIRLFEMDEKARLDTLTEAKLLAQFNHVNIVHYYECLLEGGVLNIVMEYASGGDLAAAIQRRQADKKPFSEEEIMFWFVQVVLALYHVHGKKVLHRDLKSQNIFIAEGNLLKLGDFGIARVLNSDTELAKTVIGSPYYLSPEICEDRPYNRKSDVWSLGCVLYELATLRRAFDGCSLPALVVKILRGKYPPVPSRYSSNLKGLIESMLKQNPKDRPGAEAILRSDFVRSHVERYAAHVVALGLGGGGDAAAGGGGAAAALGLAELSAAEARPRRAPRPAAARAPRASPAPPGAAGGAEVERCSSRDVSETDTASTTPADGSSPTKAGLAARRGGGRLVESGWVRQQQAVLAQLAGALAAQKAGAAPLDAERVESADGDGCMDATVAAGGAAGAAGITAAKAKLAELRLQQNAELEAQRRANAVAREQRKAAAARRNHETAVAERHLAEQKAEMEAKARKAMQLAAAVKSREEARKREAEELAQHMSAHREHVRAAKSRINKEQLSELGAQFAARMAGLATGGSAGDGGGGSSAAESAASTAGGQVLVVDLGGPQAARASPPRSRPRNASPARGGRGGAAGATASPLARAKAQSGGSAAGSDSDNAAAASGRPKPAVEPPWKQRHKPAKASEFPAVQIFTPFGSGLDAAQSAAGDGGDGSADGDDVDPQAAASVLEVLAQIHNVLEDDEDEEGDSGGAARRRRSGGTTDDEDGDGDDDAGQGGAGGGRTGGALPAAARSGADAAAANALRVEQLRIDLEKQLGATAFVAAYRCLRDMQERADAQDADAEDGAGAAAAGAGSTQLQLEAIMGPQLHLARQVHKLITLEDAVFS
ncbi:hypothetical protein GPECTOR_50g567 [Gonium pectorale]|uniref:non-specific serine/threonine protein kinase n=1 Tax=Gonium pectorale TaxID=33097 RepID=A0A150G7F9_GONPE|nr:hypothetical protein GPECTOR_50g567 [Gonium pectorale]|eukprot:KXZ45774.1 hypothetical protein GPECTOR_50g567 [Gonium pectorale]